MIDVDVGDLVHVTQRFDDGWAFGYNESTGKQGAFPIACVEDTGSRYSISTRRSSYYPQSYSEAPRYSYKPRK
jgi:hypothetical protein